MWGHGQSCRAKCECAIPATYLTGIPASLLPDGSLYYLKLKLKLVQDPAILDQATHASSIHENTIFIQKYMHRIHVPTRYSDVKSKRVARAINR